MATFIFGENKLRKPLYINYMSGFREFRIFRDSESGSDYEILFSEGDEDKIKADLQSGMEITINNSDKLRIKISQEFIFEKLQVYFNDLKLTGQQTRDIILS